MGAPSEAVCARANLPKRPDPEQAHVASARSHHAARPADVEGPARRGTAFCQRGHDVRRERVRCVRRAGMAPVSIPLFRLVQFQLEREVREPIRASRPRCSHGRVLSAVYRVSPPSASKHARASRCSLMVDPQRIAGRRAGANGRARHGVVFSCASCANSAQARASSDRIVRRFHSALRVTLAQSASRRSTSSPDLGPRNQSSRSSSVPGLSQRRLHQTAGR